MSNCITKTFNQSLENCASNYLLENDNAGIEGFDVYHKSVSGNRKNSLGLLLLGKVSTFLPPNYRIHHGRVEGRHCQFLTLD